ncbi:glycosyltransferase family 4 protein [Pseudomonas asiatica]|uniref:glycosyltransferase family 4 protein n=1 Tax=Pseudomonas asiatica TaxID=2219225 RepID=UPI003BA26AE6
MKPVLLMVINDPGFFLSHRLPIAEAARREGYQVHIATRQGPAVDDIVRLGFTHHTVCLSRSGKNPLSEIKAIYSLWLLCWRLRPNVLHMVTIKPVLYGGIVARLSPVKGVLAAISGLGFVFMASGKKATLIRLIVNLMYKVALGKRNLRAVFQNPDDLQALASIGAITADKSTLIRGSGVDLQHFKPHPEEPTTRVVTLVARLLRDKGVLEFVDAARILNARGVKVQFQLVGQPDPGNPTSITAAELDGWKSEGVVSCIGYHADVAEVLRQSHIVTLPSYREGLPKVLAEAAASARAVVTTDVPGCRDAIIPNITGLLVPVRDACALADAIQLLVEDDEMRGRMGAEGRALAEQAFAIESIVNQHLQVYQALEDGV